jgi:hypothetical protein
VNQGADRPRVASQRVQALQRGLQAGRENLRCLVVKDAHYELNSLCLSSPCCTCDSLCPMSGRLAPAPWPGTLALTHELSSLLLRNQHLTNIMAKPSLTSSQTRTVPS